MKQALKSVWGTSILHNVRKQEIMSVVACTYSLVSQLAVFMMLSPLMSCSKCMMDVLGTGVIVSQDTNPTWVIVGEAWVGGSYMGTQGSGIEHLLHDAGLQVIHGSDAK